MGVIIKMILNKKAWTMEFKDVMIMVVIIFLVLWLVMSQSDNIIEIIRRIPSLLRGGV